MAENSETQDFARPQQPVADELATHLTESHMSLLADSSDSSTLSTTPESSLPSSPPVQTQELYRPSIPQLRLPPSCFDELISEVDRRRLEHSASPSPASQAPIPRPLSNSSPSTDPIPIHLVQEAIGHIGKVFPHLKYFVTGLAALIHHGFRRRLPTSISILCPARDRDIMRRWALTCGMLKNREDLDSFQMCMTSGRSCQIKLKFLDAGFDSIEAHHGNPAGAKVLPLYALVDQLARSYTRSLAAAASDNVQKSYNADIRWTLREMIRRKEVFIKPQGMNIVRDDFLIPFMVCFPKTMRLFKEAGLVLQSESLDLSSTLAVPAHPADDDVPSSPCSIQTLGSFEMVTGLGLVSKPSSGSDTLRYQQPMLKRQPKSLSLGIRYREG